MLVELIRHQSGESVSSESKQEQVFSRLFRWSESAMFEEEEDETEFEEEEDGEEDDNKKEHGGFFGIGNWVKKDQEVSWKPKTSGLISACLCRLPPPDPHLPVTDALDVVELLSLGGMVSPSPSPTTTNKNNIAETNEISAVREQQESQTTDTSIAAKKDGETQEEFSRLVLCCLHSRGKVYVYSPRELLQNASSSSPAKKQGSDVDGDIDGDMASLFL